MDNICISNVNFNADKTIDKTIDKTESNEDSIFNSNSDKFKNVYSTNTTLSASGLIGWLNDLLNSKKNTLDGEIGYSKQHKNGNCWLLSGINSLSYTEKGKEIIKNSLDYHDGYTSVYFEGLQKGYNISNSALNQAKGSDYFSSGDDDMKIFELATEAALDDIANGNIILDPINKPWYVEDIDKLKASKLCKSSSYGGFSPAFIYYLTGLTSNCADEYDDKVKSLDKFYENNSKDICLSADFSFDKKAIDAYGYEITLYGPHAYAVKQVDEANVTIINPWDSSKDIVIPKQTFLNEVHSIYLTDLSSNNDAKQNFSGIKGENDEGYTTYTFQYDKNNPQELYGAVYDKYVKIYDSYTGLPSSVEIKTQDDKIAKACEYDLNGDLSFEYFYDQNETIREIKKYNNSIFQSVSYYDENEQITSKIEYREGGAKFKKIITYENGEISKIDYYNKKGDISKTKYYYN